MKRSDSLALLALLGATLVAACETPRTGSDDDDSQADDDDAGDDLLDQLAVQTSLGSFEIQLFSEDSPITATNFLSYVDEGFYDGEDGLGATIFHRIIADFMVQGGGQTDTGTLKQTHPAIVNEATDSGLSNTRGTLAMARTNDPDSATAQFFVNLVDNAFLDPGGSTSAGYAVFGEVTAGMDVVDAMGAVATSSDDAPLETIRIENIERL